MNRKIALLVLLPPLALLTGCNEKIESERQQGLTDRKEAELNAQIKMQERRLQTQIELAEGAGRLKKRLEEQKQAHEREKQKQTHAFMGPLLRFLTVAGAISGLIALFQFFGARYAKAKMEVKYKLEQERIRQNAAHQKYQLALEFVSNNFELLSDEQKTLVLERLETPPETKKAA